MTRRRLCYAHNVRLSVCPTRIACLYRRLMSDLAWAIIRSIAVRTPR